jgi:hypothetical protein
VLVLSVQPRDGTYGGFSTYGRLRPAPKTAMHVTVGTATRAVNSARSRRC